MTNGDRASVWVHLFRWDAQRTNAVQRLTSERLIDLEKVDIRQCQPSLLKDLEIQCKVNQQQKKKERVRYKLWEWQTPDRHP